MDKVISMEERNQKMVDYRLTCPLFAYVYKVVGEWIVKEHPPTEVQHACGMREHLLETYIGQEE